MAAAHAEKGLARDTPESLSGSIDAAIGAGQSLKARFLLSKLARAFPDSPAVYSAAVAVADYCYGTRAPAAALDGYALAAEKAAPGADLPGVDRALLRAAELSLYQARDPEAARRYLRRVRPSRLAAEDSRGFRSLSVRLNWDLLTPQKLGLSDGNVSALRADGDDVWVGTWNGGVARYSLSSGESAAFPGPASTARSIEIADRRVWVGTFEGLRFYSKVTARWGGVDRFLTPEALKVQALAAFDGDLYAGTLGDGLLRLREGQWEQVRDGAYPGKFITCLAADPGRNRLLIGTMNLGLLILGKGSAGILSLEDVHPEFTASNITALLPDSAGRVWIGTYGEGLFSWSDGAEPIRSYTRHTGEIGDDWVLAACETPRGLYFGTFGGGVSVRASRDGSWRTLGIGDGLASLDITSIAYRAPFLFFGTLGAGVSRYDEADDGAQL